MSDAIVKLKQIRALAEASSPPRRARVHNTQLAAALSTSAPVMYYRTMTRSEAIAQIAANAEKLNDEQLEGLAAFTTTLVRPSVYSTLSPAEKATLDVALDRLDRGEGIPGEEVFARLDTRIAAAKARA